MFDVMLKAVIFVNEQRLNGLNHEDCSHQTLFQNTHGWQWITVDLITELPFSLGYDAIMVVVDRLTKMIHVIPTYTSLTSEGAAQLYRDYVWKDFGLPESIISDRGTVRATAEPNLIGF